jgi:hypothetical protein
MIHIKDGDRTLQFNGELLGKSSSWRRGSLRWIEFELNKTVVYHGAACHLVKRYNLQDVPVANLQSRENMVPCDSCSPSFAAEIVFPEKNRHWAQVSENPDAVLEALYKYDDSGARYLTHVAQRLLEEASNADRGISDVYRVEIIP